MSLVCKVYDSLAHNYPGCVAYIHLANLENNNGGDLSGKKISHQIENHSCLSQNVF